MAMTGRDLTAKVCGPLKPHLGARRLEFSSFFFAASYFASFSILLIIHAAPVVRRGGDAGRCGGRLVGWLFG